MVKFFSRTDPAIDRSFALRAFNRFETEINEHFWSFAVISERSAFLARQAAKSNPQASTSQLFNASGPDAVRIPPTVAEWLEARDELENWLRLGALVSASSYLEYYLRQVLRTAFLSDPLARFGLPGSMDGVSLLKQGKELNAASDIARVTKGSWDQRAAAFKELFGPVPNDVSINISALEKIRALRNDYAHGFGRSLAVDPDPASFTPAPAARLSQARLLNYLGVISKVAAAIDSALLPMHIGNFELLFYYHKWKDLPRTGRDSSLSEHRALKTSFVRDLNFTVDVKFAQDLIKYYKAA